MTERRTWLESIEALDESCHESMLRETQRTLFRGPVPADLAFLDGKLLDMGFEHLGLAEKLNDVLRAFSSTGVAVPQTNWRLRFVYPFAVVEPVDGSEPEALPVHWKQGVLVWGDQDLPAWVGKATRHRLVGLNLEGYRDVGDGFVPL